MHCRSIFLFLFLLCSLNVTVDEYVERTSSATTFFHHSRRIFWKKNHPMKFHFNRYVCGKVDSSSLPMKLPVTSKYSSIIMMSYCGFVTKYKKRPLLTLDIKQLIVDSVFQNFGIEIV